MKSSRVEPAAAARIGVAAVLFAGALLLGGCASQLSAQVTSFHQIAVNDPVLPGRRFVIVPTEEQRNGLEFASYADEVRRALIAKKMVDAGTAGDAGRAELAVTMKYGVNGVGGAVGGSGTSGGIGIGSGGGGRGGGVSFGIGLGFPIGGGYGGGGDSLVYRRELSVTIDRAVTGAAPVRLYEGKVVSEGEGASLAPVMPAMVRALFRDFPGKSGVSQVVEVPLDEKAP